jgi:hypothetical protein
VGKPQHMREKPRRLVPCVVRAVTEVQACRPQPPLGRVQPVEQSVIAGRPQDARSRTSRRR